MSILFIMAWVVWFFAAASMAAQGIARAVLRKRALERALTITDTAKFTAQHMRALMNRGDCRDPIEKHLDSMTVITKIASLTVSAGLLWFIGTVSA
jgi:hypothetical protein